jgi:hypothetical protein
VDSGPAPARHDRGVSVNVPDRPPPGSVPGGILGVAAGLLLAAIWRYGRWDVAAAVSAVFAGLVAVLWAGAPGWRRFARALLVLAVVAGAAFALATG